MTAEQILSDKATKAKDKVPLLAGKIQEGSITIKELIGIAEKAKDPVKGTCIEAIEWVTKSRPELATRECLQLVTTSLTAKAPRVKWESAKVIGNIAARFPDELDDAVALLLANTEDPGTVVRWSAAYALGAIVKLPGKAADLKPALEAIMEREEKASIQKIYKQALKEVKA